MTSIRTWTPGFGGDIPLFVAGPTSARSCSGSRRPATTDRRAGRYLASIAVDYDVSRNIRHE
jgi:hypothetical protein